MRDKKHFELKQYDFYKNHNYNYIKTKTMILCILYIFIIPKNYYIYIFNSI